MVKVECQGCQAPYQIDERRIPPTGLKMRCPKCGTSVLVQRPGASGPTATVGAAPPAEAPARPAPPALAPPPRQAPAPPRQAPAPPPQASPPAAARPSPQAPPGGGRGFGELDLMVDLPNPDQDSGGGGDDDVPQSGSGGVDLPAVGRAAPPFGGSPFGAPPGGGGPRAGAGAPPAAPDAGFGGGFGEIDFPSAVERDEGFGQSPFGAVDLPVVSPGASRAPFGAGPRAPAAPSAAASSGVDLPAPAARRPAAPFGAIDLPVVESEAPFGAVDLPATAPRQSHAYGIPPAQRDLPVTSSSHSGLPAVGAGLPVASGKPGPGHQGMDQGGQHAGLPVFGGAGLPAFGGQAGLPSPAAAGLPSFGGHAGLPSPAGAGLPSAAAAGLPSLGGAGLPVAGGAGLPVAGGAGLPSFGGPGLPAAGGGAGLPAFGNVGLPTSGGPGLPSAGGGAGLPTVGGGFPVAAGGAGYPMTSNAAALPIPTDSLPMPGGPGFPMPGEMGGLPTAAPVTGGLPTPSASAMGFAGAGYPAVGDIDADFGAAAPPPPPAASHHHDDDGMAGAAIFGGGGGVPLAGGELDLDAPPVAPAGAGVAAPAPIPVARPSTRDDDRPIKKRSRAPKIILAGLAVAIVGGGLLGLTKVGPYGAYAISDSLNATSNEEALVELRRSTEELLAGDTISGAKKAIDRAKQRVASAPRHVDTSAYAAYLMYLKSLRFGQDGSGEAAGAAILDAVPPEAQSDLLTLARGARDATTGELARAKQSLAGLAAKDLGAAVLVGEIELLARSDKAEAAWDRAVKLAKSPRTLFGLARAQFAAGKQKEAEATAKSVLEAAPNHVGARNLLARIALRDLSRDAEVIGLLAKVLDDEQVRGEASEAELVTAYSLTGLAHLENSRMSQAEQAFAEALKLDQQAVEALVGNGDLLYRQARYSQAQARFEAASRADADSLPAKVGLAKAWLKGERAKEAKDLLKKLREGHPKDPRAAHWLGKSEEALGNRKEAQALYEEAIKLAKGDPVAVDSYVALAALLTAIGRTEDAQAKLEEASKQFPELPALYRARGDVALQAGRYDKAKQEYEIALQKRDDIGTRFQLGVVLRRMRLFDEAAAVFDQVAAVDKDYPGLALERGLYFQDTGQTDQALAMYGEALRKAPNDVDLKLRVASTQVDAGLPDKAEAALKEVIKDRPGSAEANHYYGRVLLARGQNFSEAMNYLQKAVQYDPNRAEYHLYVAIAANEAGQTGRADEAINKALELDVEMADAYWQRGVLKQKAGATLDAIADLQKALDKKPSRYEAYAALALCYEDQNDVASTENAWRYALRGNPNVPEWRYKLGRLLAQRKNDWAGAVEQLTKAVELGQGRNPRPAWLFEAHYFLAEGLDKANDKDKAITHYRRYLELAPGNHAYRADAESALVRLGAGR